MTLRLVLIHGIGGARRADIDRELWISALADGARRAGHSRAAESLVAGSLVEVVFAYYGDLFEGPHKQGADGLVLDQEEAVLLIDLIAEIIDAHRTEQDGPATATLAHARAQLRVSTDAEGTGNLVRQAINAATTLLGAAPSKRASQWAGGKLLVRDLAQVARYLSRGEVDRDNCTIDARIRGVVAAALGPGPAVVIAHSLGSVIGFETMHDYASTVPLWVTLGSPLAMRTVVWPKLLPRPPATPLMVHRWLNYWDRDDIIVSRPILEADFAANASGILPESRRVDSDGIWVHSAAKYLAQAGVAGPVIEAIESVKSRT